MRSLSVDFIYFHHLKKHIVLYSDHSVVHVSVFPSLFKLCNIILSQMVASFAGRLSVLAACHMFYYLLIFIVCFYWQMPCVGPGDVE